MNKENWFAVPIWYQDNTLTEKQFVLLKRVCYKIKRDNEDGILASNVGGWHSKRFNLNLLKDYDCAFFVDLINRTTESLLQELDCGFKFNEFNSSFWINFNQKDNHNTPHTHPRSLLSYVFYITGGSEIVFHSQSGDMSFYLTNIIESNENTYSSFKIVSYEPRPNFLLAFPPFLKHFVKPSQSYDERISIAVNIGW